MTGTLADYVTQAVADALVGETVLSLDAVTAKLPAHVVAGRPSKKSIKAAIAAAGWRPWRGKDGLVYRAPPTVSDPLASEGGHGDNVTAEQLRQFIERVERLDEERRAFSDDIKDVFAEAKSMGFDVKTMRTIIRLRGMEKHHRDEADALLEMYRQALGMH